MRAWERAERAERGSVRSVGAWERGSVQSVRSVGACGAWERGSVRSVGAWERAECAERGSVQSVAELFDALTLSRSHAPTLRTPHALTLHASRSHAPPLAVRSWDVLLHTP